MGDSQLLVSKDDRKLLMAYDEGCDLTRLNNTLQEMKDAGAKIISCNKTLNLEK